MRRPLHLCGFTLIELVVVIILVSIIAVASAPVILSSLNAYNATSAAIATLDQLRYATERIARELREVDYDSDAESYAFRTMATDQVVFDRNQVLESDTNPRTVTIAQSGGTVNLGYSGIASAPLVTGVTTLSLRYCQANGSCSGTTAANVRYIDVTLTLTLNGNDYTQNTRVELKNR